MNLMDQARSASYLLLAYSFVDAVWRSVLARPALIDELAQAKATRASAARWVTPISTVFSETEGLY